MKMVKSLLILGVGFLAVISLASEIMVSWETNGVLVADGIQPGTAASVEWAPSLTHSFTNTGIDPIVADADGRISLELPMSETSMFFRVSGTPVSFAPDGMVFIPAGINSGTNPPSKEGYSSDYPENYSLTVDAFHMDMMEVTNDEVVEVFQWAYDQGKVAAFSTTVRNQIGNSREFIDLDSSYCRITWDGMNFGMKAEKGSGYPCVEITWYGAVAYCNYRSEMEGKAPCYNLTDWSCNLDAGGYRLPTPDEWEYAARGGLSGKRFPWGDIITHNDANYVSFWSGGAPFYSYDESETEGLHPGYNDGIFPCTSPVASFAPNGYGLYDMAGNVWEWCADGNEDAGYVRGGSWDSWIPGALCGRRTSTYATTSSQAHGFRTIIPVY